MDIARSTRISRPITGPGGADVRPRHYSLERTETFRLWSDRVRAYRGPRRLNAGGRAVERAEFESLRDLGGKVIETDIRFVRSKATSPMLIAENIPISNDSGLDARLSIHYNPEVGSKTFNVHVQGVGAICRLDVDGPPHRPAGRCHKHSLVGPRCPSRNVPNVADRPELSGKGVRELFGEFCTMANIVHKGNLSAPDEVAND